MVWEWIKKHYLSLVTVAIIGVLLAYGYGCEPKVPSLLDETVMVNRQELKLELDRILAIAEIKMSELERQEQLRALIFQNALILAQGQPLNPVGIITAIAALYGVTQGSKNAGNAIRKHREKRKANSGTG